VLFGKRILKTFIADNTEQEYCELRHETSAGSVYVQVLQQPGQFQPMAVLGNTQLTTVSHVYGAMARSLLLLHVVN
jgi:hypothetical protein